MTTSRAQYAAYIASDAWRAQRDLALKRDKHRCQGCGATSGLHVHHRTYERFMTERQSDLVTVCELCHSVIHGVHRLSGRDLATVTSEVLEILARADRPACMAQPERRYRGAVPRDWRDDARNGGTWARGIPLQAADARRLNGR